MSDVGGAVGEGVCGRLRAASFRPVVASSLDCAVLVSGKRSLFDGDHVGSLPSLLYTVSNASGGLFWSIIQVAIFDLRSGSSSVTISELSFTRGDSGKLTEWL